MAESNMQKGLQQTINQVNKQSAESTWEPKRWGSMNSLQPAQRENECEKPFFSVCCKGNTIVKNQVWFYNKT